MKVRYQMTNVASKRFKCWLVEKDMTMSQFAKKSGLSVGTVSAVVLGKRNVTDNILKKFRKAGYDLI